MNNNSVMFVTPARRDLRNTRCRVASCWGWDEDREAGAFRIKRVEFTCGLVLSQRQRALIAAKPVDAPS